MAEYEYEVEMRGICKSVVYLCCKTTGQGFHSTKLTANAAVLYRFSKYAHTACGIELVALPFAWVSGTMASVYPKDLRKILAL